MYGKGIAKGMWITLNRFVTALTEDVRFAGKRYLTGGQELSGDLRLERQGPGAKGAFTVQYPFEKLPVPENFRCIPFLVYDAETREHRCTACGICAKVCPPQCIWIVRDTDSETGRPMATPKEFYIMLRSVCRAALVPSSAPSMPLK